jgi:hypothetical protein
MAGRLELCPNFIAVYQQVDEMGAAVDIPRWKAILQRCCINSVHHDAVAIRSKQFRTANLCSSNGQVEDSM